MMTLLTGCSGTDPIVPDSEVATLFLSTLARMDNAMMTQTFSCNLIAQAQFAKPLASGAVAPVQVDYQREVVGGLTPRMKTVRVPQDMSLSFLSNDSIMVTLGEPLPDTMMGQQAADGTFRGAWDCGPAFPFAADADLVSQGQDSTATIVGTWILQEPG